MGIKGLHASYSMPAPSPSIISIVFNVTQSTMLAKLSAFMLTLLLATQASVAAREFLHLTIPEMHTYSRRAAADPAVDIKARWSDCTPMGGC